MWQRACAPYETNSPFRGLLFRDTRERRNLNPRKAFPSGICRKEKKRWSKLCLTAPHRETRGQRELHIIISHSTTSSNHITVSYSTTSYDLTTERGTHDSVSRHRILRPDDREVHVTMSHSTTSSDLMIEVHITMSHSTTSHDLTTERGTHYNISQRHIA